MRKSVVLALGVLLAIAGLLSIWQGLGVIEFERGTAAVISGAVLLAGGVITVALSFLLGAVEDLQRQAGTQLAVVEEMAPAATQPEAAPKAKLEPVEAPADLKLPPVPPLLVRDEVSLPPLPIEPPKFEVSKFEEPKFEPPQFEQPKTDAPKTDAPKTEASAPVPSAAPTAAVASTVAAATGGFFAIRNFFSRRAEPVKAAEVEPDETSAPKLPDFLVRRDVMQEQPLADEGVEAQETQETQELAQDQSQQGPTDEDKYAWLEKALSGEDEPKPEPEFDWLRNRTSVEPSKDAIFEEVHEQEIFEEEEILEEPAQDVAAPQQDEAPAPVAPPTVVGRYNSGGSEYTLYSDGSIDAETAEGHLHFASMADLRAHIEAQQNRG